MGINDKLFRKPALYILTPSQCRNFKTFKIMENMYWGEHAIVTTFVSLIA